MDQCLCYSYCVPGGEMVQPISRRQSLRGLAALAATPLAGCGTWINYEDISGNNELKGTVNVEWIGEDKFIYHPRGEPLSFRPSFMTTPIVPETMFTDGGSVPRVFWGIPGLSPWGLGPAYIIHDWLFFVHRCNPPNVPAEVRAIDFDKSALILAEIGKALIEHGLIEHNMLEAIVWGVRTRYAEGLWNRPGTPQECTPPRALRSLRGKTVVNFTIPPKIRRLR
jgi:hypothetical protein